MCPASVFVEYAVFFFRGPALQLMPLGSGSASASDCKLIGYTCSAGSCELQCKAGMQSRWAWAWVRACQGSPVHSAVVGLARLSCSSMTRGCEEVSGFT